MRVCESRLHHPGMGRSIELVQLKSMTVNVVCREPTSRQKSASAVVLAVPLIYLMSR